eukprot:TRINITY_DN2257_c1_g1_i1.p1 TRINITY_DN2257_c1_g1~~TRINITY_DN2257_c1_g1_i1.p1  ORF type:complete len:372 (-),score=76.39 TRINITY_DN2257_c1_g1_i1:145-1239(-)
MEDDEASIEYREWQKYLQSNLREQQQHSTTKGEAVDYLTEHDDTPHDVLLQQATRVAELLRGSKHAVIMTGAGVSTASGLPDYRGPKGVWTKRVQRELQQQQHQQQPVAGAAEAETSIFSDIALLEPTYSHKAIALLLSNNIVKHVISTNVDGLHVKSGLTRATRNEAVTMASILPPSDHSSLATQPHVTVSELHGNMFVEECATCLRQYYRYPRSVPVPSNSLFEHGTKGTCEQCDKESIKNNMRDVIVNFGNTVEQVPSMEHEYDRAWSHCKRADVMLVLGSSLSVPNACDLPNEFLDIEQDNEAASSVTEQQTVSPSNKHLVICNLQHTPKDALAEIVVHARCDAFMQLVMQQLGLPTALP